VIGRVLGPVGIGGDVRVQVVTDFPERFRRVRLVHLGDNLRPYRVQAARVESGGTVLHLAGVDDAAAAQALAGQDVQVPIDEAVELEPDQFFWHEIVGLEVWSEEAEDLGQIVEVIRTGSNDVYVVRKGAREILVPAIEDVVREVDLDRRRMTVRLLPGMAD
jgi:16S rRNA processing protein RimM